MHATIYIVFYLHVVMIMMSSFHAQDVVVKDFYLKGDRFTYVHPPGWVATGHLYAKTIMHTTRKP